MPISIHSYQPATLPADHQSRLDRELDEGEEIRWVAQPMERLLRKQAIGNWGMLMFLASMFGIGFGLIGLLGYLYPNPQDEAPTVGMMVFGGVIMSLGLLSFPLFLWNARLAARNTIYAITDRRAIVLRIHRNGSTTERDYRGDELIHLARQENPDGTGTLTFESARGAGHTSQTASRHKFQAIERVIEVERMLRDQFGVC